MATDWVEVNFDAIVGPTHNYAGLSPGNLASQKYANQPSNPKAAALEGLAKMKLLADLGIPQAVLPPHQRPDVAALRSLGFSGSDGAALEQAAREKPALLAACGSASAMWAANAATISPATDTTDGKTHFTAANLRTQFHRALETETTVEILKRIFSHPTFFVHHPPLPTQTYGDEGAANHMRLSTNYGASGLEIFVYGRSANQSPTTRFPARQTLEACQTIAQTHNLRKDRVRFVSQNPAAIDAGAFHNDVVAVSNLNVLFFHQAAWTDATQLIQSLADHFEGGFFPIEVTESEVPLADAVSSYLFNSQIVGTDAMTLIAPAEAREIESSRKLLDSLPQRGTPIKQVRYVDVRQSMQNGGGPACLRLRVVMNPAQIESIQPRVFLDDELYGLLRSWVERNYRERLTPADLGDYRLLEESRRALDELTSVLRLGSIYPFQRP